MGKKVFAVVAALVAAQVLSGCYILRELNWSDDKVKAGEKSTATLGFMGSGATAMTARGSSEGRFFLIATGEASEGVSFKRPTFDSKDQIGAKEKLTPDPDLYDLVFDSGSCSSFIPLRQGGPPGQLWRTEDDVQETNKFVQGKLKMKAAGDAVDGGFGGLILSGYWIDDGDGVAEDPDSTDDEIGCSGFMTTTLVINGAAP